MSVVKILPIIVIVIERVLDGTLRSLKRCYFLAYIKSLTAPPPQWKKPIGQESGSRSDISVGIYALIKEISHVVP